MTGAFPSRRAKAADALNAASVPTATAGTTTLLAAWAQTHCGLQRTLIEPAGVLMAWSRAHAVMTPGSSPWGGMAVAVTVGLYATDARRAHDGGRKMSGTQVVMAVAAYLTFSVWVGEGGVARSGRGVGGDGGDAGSTE